MLDVLNDYLKETTTPELREMVESAHASFERIGLEHFNDGFEQILMLDGDTDHGGTVTSVVDLTDQLLRQLLLEHEVVVGPDTSIDIMTAMVNGLLDLQDYEIKEDILRIADMASNPVEKFVELLTLVTPYAVEELLLDVESVGASLITRLREMYDRGTEEINEEEQTRLQQYIDRFTAFQRYLHSPKLHIVEMLKDGMQPGYPFITYAALIGRELESMQPERAAQELLSIALVSSDGHDNPRAIIQNNIDHFIADLNKVTKIDVKIG